MKLSKDDLKAWMIKNYHTKQWLAEKCNVSTHTVANWLTSNTRPIPKSQTIQILKLIEQDQVIKQNLVLKFSTENFKKLESTAYKTGQLIHDWAEETLLKQANTTSTTKDQ